MAQAPVTSSYDYAVIGGGPGGYISAIRASQLGLKTVCIEKEHLGGVCLNWGCIPTKTLLKSAELLEEIRHADKHGLKVDGVSFDFTKVVGRSRDVAGRLNRGIGGLFKKYKVESIMGKAVLSGPNAIDVTTKDGAQKITAKTIVVATGARPKFLPELKPDGKTVITSHEAMILPKPPKSLLIVGAGAIGIEFAYFYSVFGTKVTVVEFQDSILPLNDRELSVILAKSLTRRGIAIHTASKLDKIVVSAKGITAEIVGAKPAAGAKGEAIEAEVCLSAVGMTGNIEELGLEKAGVKTDRGFVVVDKQNRTSVKNIFAIGDVAGAPLLAHKASTEGHGVAELAAGHFYEGIDKNQIPGCTYCHPQYASIGLTEEQCKARNLEYVVGKFPFVASGMAIAAADDEGLVKLIFGKKYGELIGAHILCGHAADLISELGLALRLECTYEEILATIHAHPTLSEAVKEAAAQAFGLATDI